MWVRVDVLLRAHTWVSGSRARANTSSWNRNPGRHCVRVIAASVKQSPANRYREMRAKEREKERERDRARNTHSHNLCLLASLNSNIIDRSVVINELNLLLPRRWWFRLHPLFAISLLNTRKMLKNKFSSCHSVILFKRLWETARLSFAVPCFSCISSCICCNACSRKPRKREDAKNNQSKPTIVAGD